MSRELLTTPQIARMRSVVTDYLPADVTVSILRQADPRTPNGLGGFVETWQTVGSAIPALLTPFLGRSGGAEDVRDGRFEQTLFWKISMPALTDVLAADRITTSDREFEVRAVAAPESLEVIREAICVERLSG